LCKLINAQLAEIRHFLYRLRATSLIGKEIRKRRVKRNGRLKFYAMRTVTRHWTEKTLFHFQCNLAWLSRGIIRIDKLILWMYPVTRSTSVENDIHHKKMTTGQLV